jgi:DNA-binding FrmR family transcriptional regulator
MDKVEAVDRLREAVAQINEIAGLVGETERCLEAIWRIRWVQQDLRCVYDGLLEGHLMHCLDAVLQEDRSETMADHIRDVFGCMHRSGW